MRRIWALLAAAFALLGSIAGSRAAEAAPGFLTADERAWLQSHAAELCVAPEANYPPFSFMEGGVWRGLSADILRLVEAKLGSKLPILDAQNLDALLSRAQSGAAGIVTSVRETPERSQYLSFTEPYVSLPTVIIVKTGSAHGHWPEAFAGKRVAIGKGYGVQKFLEQKFPDLKLVPVPDDLDGLRQLSFGEIDAVIMDVASASFFIEREKITNLRVFSTFDYRYDLRMAVRKDLPVLREILAKTLRDIPKRDHAAVLNHWIQLETDPLTLMLEKYRWVLPLGLTVLVLLLGVGATFWMLALFRRNTPRNLAAALVVLAAGLLVTGVVVFYIKTDAEGDAQRKFDFVGDEIRLEILARLRACAQVLHSGAALFDASISVEREEWRAFAEGLELDQQLPGVQGIGFARLIARAQLAEHVQAIRRDGFPDYQVKPAGDRETYSPIIYLEPFTDRNLRAFGYDMLSEPVRGAAMERARDTHAAALSGKVTLVQESGQEVQAGTLMYVPVYRRRLPLDTIDQRRAALQGWVYSPYRMDDLIRGILRDWKMQPMDHPIDFQIYDGGVPSAETLLFDSQRAGDKVRAATALVTRLAPVEFAGRRWTLRFTQAGGLAATADYAGAWFSFVGGTIISLLLFGLTLSLLGMRAHAQQIAVRLTQELRTSEANYRALAENIPQRLFIKDRNSRFISVNKNFARDMGISPEAAVGKTTADFFPKELADKYHAEDRRIMETGRAEEFEEKRIQDSHEIWVHTIKTPVRDASGTVVGVCGISHDISERKRAQQAVAKITSELQSVIESAGDIIATLDTDYRYRLFNSAFRIEFKKIFGHDLKLGDSMPQLLASVPADLAMAMQFWNRALAGEDFTVTQEFGDTALERNWYEFHFSPVLDHEGKVAGGVHTVRNVTERKRADALLRESEERYRRLVEGAPGVVYTFSSKHGGIYYSPHVERVLGYSPDHLCTHPLLWNKSIHPEDQDQISQAIREFASGKSLDLEYRIKDVQGNWRWLWDRSIGCQVKNDEIVIEGLAIDITERKQAAVYMATGHEILQILNQPGDMSTTIKQILAVLKTRTGFDAVGIRLQDGEDFPYFVQEGFCEDFLLKENTLVERGADGGLCRGKDGKVCLECTCGLVILGQTDPAIPFFTKRGSFWTNDSFPLLDLPSDQDPRHHPRNQCVHHGYASVTLVPIRSQNAIVGLIQLNDRRKGCLSLLAVELLEDIGMHIGAALMRLQAERLLRASLVEKTALLREVHHRVKNNLQIISSLLSLQAGQVQNQEVLALLSVTRNRVGAMALLHEHLYLSESLARLNLADYVANLCSHLRRAISSASAHVRIEHHVEREHISMGLDQAVPCGLMINELVTNALKYAFPGDRAGCIRVTIERATPQELRLTVADDGIGLPAGLDPRETQSLGLQLVGMLTQQLRGTVNFGRGLGTTVQIVFPVPVE